jgi:Uma2 family endonuclease
MSDEYTERPMTAEIAWNETTYWDDVAVPYWLTGNLTAEMWEEMPEGICRRIEVIGGQVIFMQSPSRDHQKAVSLLWMALRGHSAKAAADTGQCLDSSPDADLRLDNAPLHHRRPDVIVFRCIERTALPAAEDALLVVEIVSPTSRVTDKIEKLAVYAEAGVPHYWIVETRNGAISTVTWYALPEDDKRYEVRACWTPAETPEGIRAEEPFPVRIAWDELAF